MNKSATERNGTELTAVLARQVVGRLLEDPGAGLVVTVGPQATVDTLRHHPVGRGEGDDDGEVGEDQEHQPHDRTARRHHLEGLETQHFDNIS